MIYWAKKHQCVSCQYWKGEREICSDPRVVECTPGTKGMCMGADSHYRGKQVDCSLHIGGEACYQCWYSLRE